MSDTMKDGTPIAERWAETYAGIEYAAQCCDGWIDGEDELAKQLIEELSRAESELAEANLYAAKLKAEMGKLKRRLDAYDSGGFADADAMAEKYLDIAAERDALKADNTTFLRALTEEDAAVIHRVTSAIIAARAKEQP